VVAVEDRASKPLAGVGSGSVKIEEVGAVVGVVVSSVNVVVVVVVVVVSVVRAEKGVVEPIWRGLMRIGGRFGSRVGEQGVVNERLVMVLLLVSEMVKWKLLGVMVVRHIKRESGFVCVRER